MASKMATTVNLITNTIFLGLLSEKKGGPCLCENCRGLGWYKVIPFCVTTGVTSPCVSGPLLSCLNLKYKSLIAHNSFNKHVFRKGQAIKQYLLSVSWYRGLQTRLVQVACRIFVTFATDLHKSRV